MIALSTVFVFSLVQSLFGMGLLIFGTPTLLLLGLDFSATLATLLPASITISFIQVLEDRSVEPRFVRQFALWCLPPLGLGLLALIRYQPEVPLEPVLGTIMFVFASFQLMPEVSSRARDAVRRNSNAWMVVMGTVHGLSNLGGSVLSVVANAYFSDKLEIRRTIAFCYLSFAIVQILILLVFQPDIFNRNHLLTMALAGTVYILLGRRTFRWLPQMAYQKLFVMFMFAYAFILFGKGFGLV
jgi:uncharacterized membrane protein YfcA